MRRFSALHLKHIIHMFRYNLLTIRITMLHKSTVSGTLSWEMPYVELTDTSFNGFQAILEILYPCVKSAGIITCISRGPEGRWLHHKVKSISQDRISWVELIESLPISRFGICQTLEIGYHEVKRFSISVLVSQDRMSWVELTELNLGWCLDLASVRKKR